MTAEEILTRLIERHFERCIPAGEKKKDWLVWMYREGVNLRELDEELNDAMVNWAEENKILFADCEVY